MIIGSEATAEIQNCPVCGHRSFHTQVQGHNVRLTSGVIGSSRAEVSVGTVLRCDHCGHGFRPGRFSDEELGALYRTMDISQYEAEEKFRIATARRHARLLGSPKRPGDRLLDVGCASGLFLEAARENGWLVTGVDPNTSLTAKAAERLGAANIRSTTLAKAHLEPGLFAAITAWDVLEHVSDPTSFLQHCAGLLRVDGVVWLKAPDIGSLQARLMGARWPVYLPEHLGYFSKQSLTLCANGAGLAVVKLTRCSVTFSAGYILYRIAQHGLPFARTMQKAIECTGLTKVPIPLRLGEMCACLAIGNGRDSSLKSLEDDIR